MNDIVTQIYQTALKKAGKNGKALRDMALYAVEIYNAFGKTSDEMDAVYAAYRRSEVNSMICAVVAMDGRPDWFQRKRARHADDYLSLYKVCSLGAHDRAWMLAEFVKQDDAGELDDLQIWMERVSELKTRKPRERKPRVCPHCGKEIA